jgi:hypothetical protein
LPTSGLTPVLDDHDWAERLRRLTAVLDDRARCGSSPESKSP